MLIIKLLQNGYFSSCCFSLLFSLVLTLPDKQIFQIIECFGQVEGFAREYPRFGFVGIPESKVET